MENNVNQAKEVVDLEAYAREGKSVPLGQAYRIKVGKEYFTATTSTMMGRDILTLAGKTPPERHILQRKIKDQVTRVALDQPVDFTETGLERFMTIPNEVTEG